MKDENSDEYTRLRQEIFITGWKVVETCEMFQDALDGRRVLRRKEIEENFSKN